MDFTALLKELPYMFAILAIVWIIVVGLVLKHLFSRKELSTAQKAGWIALGLIPLIGILIYGVAQFKKTKAILLATLMAIGISTVTVWYFAIYQQSAEYNDRSNEKGIVNTAENLVQEFITNEAAANQKYTNKMVEVSGVIEKTETGASTIVFLKAGNNGYVSANLKQSVSGLTTGSTITVKGIFTGFILGEVQLTEASILGNQANNTNNNTEPTGIVNDASNQHTSIKTTSKDSVSNKPTVHILKSSSGTVRFFSSTPAEDIEANNNQLISSINTTTGELDFAALIKGFRFENKLMEKHFNEDKYLHSSQFPKATFKGKITNLSSVNLQKDGTYTANAEGNLTIRGVTKKLSPMATITVTNGRLTLQSKFKIRVAEFGIPADDVADQIEITVTGKYN